jgi:hypothetical protein
MSKKLNILITEDKPIHLVTLDEIRSGGHSVDVSTSFSQSRKALGDKKYDVLLTDLFFSYGNVGYAAQSDIYNEHPLGFSLIFAAALAGIEKIALVTDCNHHSNAVANTFDAIYLRGTEGQQRRPFFKINNSRVILLDERDLPGIYKTRKGEIGPLEKVRSDPEWYNGAIEIKNYKAALDLLLKE